MNEEELREIESRWDNQWEVPDNQWEVPGAALAYEDIHTLLTSLRECQKERDKMQSLAARYGLAEHNLREENERLREAGSEALRSLNRIDVARGWYPPLDKARQVLHAALHHQETKGERGSAHG